MASVDEDRARLRYLQLKAKAAAAKPAPAPPPRVPESPGLLARARDRLTLGLSDALSSAAGDTYGRDGDPTRRDNLDPRGRLMKVAGGDVIPAIGSVIADTAITAGKTVLPKVAENVIADAAQTVAESPPVQAVGKGLARWKAASPGSYAAAGDAANVLATVAPAPRPALTTGTRATQRLTNRLAQNRQRETMHMLTPDNPFDQGNLVIADDVMASKTFVPNARYQGVIDETASVPGVNPRQSFTHNVNALDDHVTQLDEALAQRLAGAPPIPAATVAQTLQDSVARAADQLTLVADAGTFADTIYARFNQILAPRMAGGQISPQDLLDARRELDVWLRNSPTDVFSPGGAASKVATREIRQAINDLVDTSAPTAGVRADLTRMNRALEARDALRPHAVSEGENRFSRYLATLERSTGLKHPVNPQSAYITLKNPSIGVVAGAAALAMGLRRGFGESFGKFNARMEMLLQEAINRGAPPAERAAILAAINQEKEKRHAARQ